MFQKCRVGTRGERLRARCFLEFQEENQTSGQRKLKSQKQKAGPLQSLEGLDGEVWSEKEAASLISHRDFSAFSLQRAVKTISISLLFPGQKSLSIGLSGWIGLATNQACPEG